MKNTLNKNLYLEWHILKNLISNGKKKYYEFEKGDSFFYEQKEVTSKENELANLPL